jgi:hypothetical protein
MKIKKVDTNFISQAIIHIKNISVILEDDSYLLYKESNYVRVDTRNFKAEFSHDDLYKLQTMINKCVEVLEQNKKENEQFKK